MPKYDKPSFFTKSVANFIVMLLARIGVSAGGANTLVVRGRKSGEPRSVALSMPVRTHEPNRLSPQRR